MVVSPIVDYLADPREKERAKDREYKKARYASDPEFRAKRLEYQRKLRASDPEFRATKKEYMREYARRRRAADPKWRSKENEQLRKRYATDPEYRAKWCEYGREWKRKKRANPSFVVKERENKRKSSHRLCFALSSEKYNAMLVAQGGVCAMCKQPNPSGKALAVDHDHRCCSGKKTCGKCIRGLLCQNCNTGIGYLKDSPALLHAGIEYIMQYAA